MPVLQWVDAEYIGGDYILPTQTTYFYHQRVARLYYRTCYLWGWSKLIETSLLLTYLESTRPSNSLIKSCSIVSSPIFTQHSKKKMSVPHCTKLWAETLSWAKAVEKKISEVFKARNFYGLCEGASTNDFVVFRTYHWERSHLLLTPGLLRLVTHTFQWLGITLNLWKVTLMIGSWKANS